MVLSGVVTRPVGDMLVDDLTKDDLERIGREWSDRLKASEKREKDWRGEAEKAECAYLVDAKDGKEVPSFNILHSNVETIVPAIYNSTPRPEIRPRHNNRDDKVGKFAADVYERTIAALIDDNALDAEIEQGAQDAFMAGRDIVRIRFEADEQRQEIDGEEYIIGVENETIVYENVSWRDYREGPAKRWRDVPWVAYAHEVSEEEKERLENPDYVAKFADDPMYAQKRDGEKDCRIWEIWCKDTRKVYFLVEDSCRILDILEDPLELDEFFPQGEPVQPITGTGKRTPVCPYSVYKVLAEELDTATKRINAIMKGLKVRGVIAGDADVLEKIAELGDNEIAPIANIENLAATGGLDKAVLWWPVEQAILVLRELYAEREQAKQAIYEVTGISDIIRGQGAASETATAQNIKTQWGALRIKKMQRLIERQVRDLFKLSAEVIAKHFSPMAIQKLSGLELIPASADQLAALPPEQRAAASKDREQKTQVLKLVKQWDKFRIDVESDSTVRADMGQNREEMARFLEGTGQFFATMAPIAEKAPRAVGALAKMYAAFASQFNLGKAAEDALDEFIMLAEKQGEAPPQPSLEQIEMERRAKLDEARFKLDTEKHALDKAVAEAAHGVKIEETSIKRDALTLDEAKLEVEAAEKLSNAETEERPN